MDGEKQAYIHNGNNINLNLCNSNSDIHTGLGNNIATTQFDHTTRKEG